MWMNLFIYYNFKQQTRTDNRLTCTGMPTGYTGIEFLVDVLNCVSSFGKPPRVRFALLGVKPSTVPYSSKSVAASKSNKTFLPSSLDLVLYLL